MRPTAEEIVAPSTPRSAASDPGAAGFPRWGAIGDHKNYCAPHVELFDEQAIRLQVV